MNRPPYSSLRLGYAYVDSWALKWAVDRLMERVAKAKNRW